jgi:hypothetical protein
MRRVGRIEREVVTAADGADLLIVAAMATVTASDPKPRSPHPLRRRPRTVPGATGLARPHADPRHHPATATAAGPGTSLAETASETHGRTLDLARTIISSIRRGLEEKRAP